MRGLLVAVLLCAFAGLVIGHSERFHVQPYNGGRLSKNTLSGKYIGQSETHLTNVRAITNGGTNAEAYWSFDGYVLFTRLILKCETERDFASKPFVNL